MVVTLVPDLEYHGMEKRYLVPAKGACDIALFCHRQEGSAAMLAAVRRIQHIQSCWPDMSCDCTDTAANWTMRQQKTWTTVLTLLTRQGQQQHTKMDKY